MSEGSSRIPIPIKGISCQDLLLKHDIVHSGYLRRRHFVNKVFDSLAKSTLLPTWPNCYVVLRNGCLYIYDNERSKKTVKACSLYGFLHLHECDESELPANISWAFKLASELDLNNRSFYFSAPTQTDMGKWIDCIQEQMNYANNFRCAREAASASSWSRNPVSSRPAAACLPVGKVKPKQSSVDRPIPPPIPPPRDLVYEQDDENHSGSDYDEISVDDADEKKLQKNLPSNVKGNMLSQLKISDKPRALKEPSKAAEHDDYMCPVLSPAVKPKPVLKKQQSELKLKPSAEITALRRTEEASMAMEAAGYYGVERDTGNDTSQVDEETAEYSANEEYPTFTSPRGTGLETLIQKAYWFGESKEGEKLMRSLEDDGIYMIRASREAGKETMMVRCGSEVRKFHIMVPEDGRYSLMSTGPYFETMKSLIQFYKENNLPLPLRETKLTQPYTALGYANR